MKTNLLIALFSLAILGSGAWWYLNHKNGQMQHQHESTDNEDKNPQYICPMHPQITSDHPGTCPICGMDLVNAKEFEEDEEEPAHDHGEGKSDMLPEPSGRSVINLPAQKQKLIGVKLAKAEKKKLFKTIRAPGRIAFDPELYTAQSEYLEALKQWQRVKNSPIIDVKENTRQMIRSSKIRLKVLGLSDDQISQLAKRGFQSEGLLFSGEGQENWVYADVFEMDLPYIKKGLSAQITANFLQGKTLPAKVISVDQVINPQTRTAKVRIQLLKSDEAIRPESYVNVAIFAPMGEHVAVPIEALIDTGRDIYVFRESEVGFTPVKVNVVLETDDYASVAGDISAGDRIVIDGNFMMDSESRLKSVINKNTSNHDHGSK